MAAAARLTDPIGHSPTMSWLLTGLLVGAAIGVAVAATVATGGLAAVAIVGGAAAGGAGLMEVFSTMSFAGKEVVGAITAVGAANVFMNGVQAARAHLDFATCAKHPGPAIIAEGSDSVFINGMPAARGGDRTVCSAVITEGSGDVWIGGGTFQTDQIHPENLVPGAVHAALLVVGIGSALVLAAPLVVAAGLAGGMAGGLGGGWLGGKIFGEGSDGQKWMMLGGGAIGGFAGPKGGNIFARARTPEPPVAIKPVPVSTKGNTTFDANELRLSQNSVSFNKVDRTTGEKYTYDELVSSMREDGWRGDPVDLVRMPDGKLTSMDNTRITAAREAGIPVQGTVRNYDDPLSPSVQEARGWGNYNTWGEAITGRINNQSRNFGRDYPYGSPESPQIKGRKQ